ncbi:MAG: hypothetical protein NTX29_10575 [Actinobacteria bacterium]|nr:hypothetical protein [Actinomycetota bacterium]
MSAARGARVDMIAVFDIDGVLADASHRQHHVDQRPKDWSAFFAEVGADEVIDRGRELVGEMAGDHVIVLLSGRPESTRADTEAWLAREGIHFSSLILRPDRDHSPAADFKAGALAAIGAPDVIGLVVDDDETVVYRLAGLGYRVEHFR